MKLVRGGPRVGVGRRRRRSLDAADDLDVPIDTRSDLDVGAMAMFGRVRLGVSVKNLRDAGVRRRATTRSSWSGRRAPGVAVMAGPASGRSAIDRGVDADLTTTPTPSRRRAARRRRASRRGCGSGGRRCAAGVSVNTVGEPGDRGSVGASVGAAPGLLRRRRSTFGADDGREMAGRFALRVTF